MVQEDITNVFMENPSRNFHIRGISKSLGIPKTTVSYHVKYLLKNKLILREEKGVFPSFRANTSSEVYRFHKRQESLRKIIHSGLLDYLEEEFNPRCIFLFGSFAKAEYDIDSDIDIFLQAKETDVNLAKFEKKLRHKINLIIELDLAKLSPELFNNIINGIRLRGFMKLK